MKNTKKGFAPIILVIIGIIALGAGSYLLFNKKISPQTQLPIISQHNNIGTTTSNFVTTTTESINKDLETEAYVNQKSRFSIHLPKGWMVADEKESHYWGADSIFYQPTARDPSYSEGVMLVILDPFSGKNLDNYLAQINKSDYDANLDKRQHRDLKIETRFTVGGEDMYILDDGSFFSTGRGGVTLITLSNGKAYRLIGELQGPERRKIIKESMMTFRPPDVMGKVENIQQFVDENLLAKDITKSTNDASDERIKEIFSRIMTGVGLYFSEHSGYGIQATTTSANICANGGGIFSDPGIKSDIAQILKFTTGTSNIACAASNNYYTFTAPLKSGGNLCIDSTAWDIKTVTGIVTERWSTGCSGVLN